MKSLILNATLALGMAFGAAACGSSGGGESCDKLAKAICDGKDDAYCEKARKWVDKEMVGPDGKKMNAAQSDVACKMIVEDSTVVGLYKKNAAEEIK